MTIAAALALVLPLIAQTPGPLTIPAPIKRWDEAIPLGNGITGGLLWGEGSSIHLSLDRADLWDERTPEMLQRPDWTYAKMKALKEAHDHKTHQEMFDAPYDTIPYPTKLPGGRLEIALDPTCTATAFSLDLATAEAKVDLSNGKLTAFYSAVAPFAMLRITGPVPQPSIVRPAGLDKLGYGPATSGHLDDPDQPLIWMTQSTLTGLEYTIAVGSHRDGDTSTLALAIDSTPAGAYDGPSSESLARGHVAAALRDGYDKSLADSAAWWSRLWVRSSISIPDPGLQRQYDVCKYFYGAASSSSAPPIPLQGVWTCDNGDLPPWKGDYHNDLNTQMTYLAYPTAGLFDQGRSFLNFNSRLLPQYRAFARDFYGVQGAVVPGVMTLGGKPMGGWGQYSLSPTHSAWIAQSFYLHWRYTGDDQFLKETAYPWCAAVGDALRALLIQDPSGHLKLPLSSSPEIFDNSYKAWLPPNSNYDLALLRFLFAANAEMASAIGAAPDQWLAALKGLDALDTDPATGSLTFAPGLPFNASHRHFSHAMAIHPLGLITIEGSDDDRRVISATLDQIESQGTSAWCGYSFSWFAAMNARAGRADKALEYLKKFERGFIGPNGFHLNGDQSGTGLSSFTYRPFTLEGNFLAMQAIQEMLLQSWGEVGKPDSVVRIFPATPGQWTEVSFCDLRAEGGFRVSARRNKGETRWVRIVANRPGTLRLRDPFPGKKPEWTGQIPARSGPDWTVHLDAGAAVEAALP